MDSGGHCTPGGLKFPAGHSSRRHQSLTHCRTYAVTYSCIRAQLRIVTAHMCVTWKIKEKKKRWHNLRLQYLDIDPERMLPTPQHSVNWSVLPRFPHIYIYIYYRFQY